jgi:5-hydroxyisourate hydrolase
MNAITTHVLDTASGRPAEGVAVRLLRHENGTWREIARTTTDADGRSPKMAEGATVPGRYRLRFAVREYFAASDTPTFYPVVLIDFEIARAEHHHVPLLLSPWGYSTYRGS